MSTAVTAVSVQFLVSTIASFQIAMNTGEPVIGFACTPEHSEGLGIDNPPWRLCQARTVAASQRGEVTPLLVSGNGAPEERIGQHRNVIEAAKIANGKKKIVYTSVQGAETGTAFSPVIQKQPSTEADAGAIAANRLGHRPQRHHIEPDIEYIESCPEGYSLP
ncbi:MAG: hypothetical protein R3F53_19385 [Gammaproteobacteria bacterium]